MYDIISLSDLVSMWKIETNSYFQTRQERFVYVHMTEKIKGPHYERGLCL